MNNFSQTLAVAALVLSPSFVGAANCDESLAQLRAELDGQSTGALLDVVNILRGAGCSQATERAAMGQASAVLAQRAQQLIAVDDLDGADAMLANAPALHWAVQAVRGDIAAERGQREEAAQMYSAALDTITDPTLTASDVRLVPVAERIALLAQENLMLSGSLSSAITRGGAASGVLKSAMRGIQIESLDSQSEPTANTETYVAPNEAGSYVDVPSINPYGEADKEVYAVADAVAKSVKAVYLPIKFAFGSADFDAAGVREAQTVANFLLSNKIKRLSVVGHTDEIGSNAYNIHLSLQRAQTVKHFLIGQGVHAQIYVDGKGESQPPQYVDQSIYSDEERRAIARRVELVLHE
jgi:outer membrane protein OmpA-like peptidoglycan-associated protein